jgi:hypothetical protein
MVLVSSIWREAKEARVVGKRTAIPRPPDHELFSSALPRLPHTARPSLPVLQTSPRGAAEDQYRRVNRERLPPRTAADDASEGNNFMRYAEAALRSGVSIFPSQPAPAVSPFLGPINTSTMPPRQPAPLMARTPRSLASTFNSIPTSARSSHGWTISEGSRNGRSALSSPRRPDTSSTRSDGLLSPRTGAPRYFAVDSGYTNGYERVTGSAPKTAACDPQAEQQREFEATMLSPERCSVALDDFEHRKLQGVTSFPLL